MAKWIRKLPVIRWLYTALSNILAEEKRTQAQLLAVEDRIRAVETELGRVETELGKVKAKIGKVAPKLDGLKYDLDVQCIIGKDMVPSPGFESVQAGLIERLPKKSDEFVAYNRLPIEHLIGYADGKTVIAAHYAGLFSEYASANEIPGIEPVGVEPAQLLEACLGKDTLIIANPTLSALVLTSPSLLRDLSKKLSRNLVLPVWVSPYPIYVNWEGFSIAEQEEQGTFRWALGRHSAWNIHLLSGLSNPAHATLRWRSEALDNAGEFSASCCGETVQAELNRPTDFELNVLLQPGDNMLSLAFSGTSRAPENDRRTLAFRIVNFSCYIEGEDVLADFLYKGNELLLSDNYIRRALHQHGFYDVTSVASAHHGLSRRELTKSRYRYVAGAIQTRIVSSCEVLAPSDAEIVCYHAYRLRRTEDL